MKLSKELLNKLTQKASEGMQNSYSPYSKFKVGAAVLGQSGKIYQGTNIENASFGVTICAERCAIFSAIAAGEKAIKAIVIVFKQKSPGPLSTPCGACRQVMAEFGNQDMPVCTAALDGKKVKRIVCKKLKDYYPYPFNSKALNKI